MQKMTRQLRQEFTAKGWPAVEIGVGVNTGLMNVGDMGSLYRRAYTVLGDAVNLGSRLESITKFYGAQILVSEYTRTQAPQFIYRFVDRIQVKGKNEAVSVYEPLCLQQHQDDQLALELAAYQAAHELYLEQQWSAAKQAFAELTQRYPQQRLYQVYQQRIDDLQLSGVAPDWDGVFRHTQK